MKLITIAAAVTLALAGTAASAATVGTLYDPVTGEALPDNPEIGPLVYTVFQMAGPQTGSLPSFDYVYNFQLDAQSNLNVSGNTYTGPTVDDGSAVFSLYSGTSTGNSGAAANLVGGTFTFSGQDISATTFSNLAAGNYFFEIAGQASTQVGTAFNVTIQAPSATGPLPAVPEPANMALLLAGLGLMGFMAKRRSQR